MTNSEFLSFLSTRQSTRAYDSNRSVETEKIMRCIEAAQVSPSACNAQPWKFIVVDDPELKNQIADHTTAGRISPMNHWTRQAPVLVVVVREFANLMSKIGSILKNKKYTLMDIGNATTQFCLQAHAEGLSTCIMGWFNEKKIKKLLHIPLFKRAELIIALGYAPEDYPLRKKVRKDISEIHSFNRY